MRSFTLLILITLSTVVTAQVPDGIYLGNKSFLNCSPEIILSQLHKQKEAVRSIKSWLKSDSLFYADRNRTMQKLDRSNIWGYAESGYIYINKSGLFQKLQLAGMISYFNEVTPVANAPFSPVMMDQSKNSEPMLLDMATGAFYKYEPVELLRLLMMHDEELFNHYNALERKRQKKLLYIFIERFNARHKLMCSTDKPTR